MHAPVRTSEEAFANDAFAALLNATARPGQVETLPGPDFAPIIAALIDRECTFFASDEKLIHQLSETGARFAAAEAADFVFAQADDVAALLPKLKVGSDLYPDDGATLIVAARAGAGDSVRLSGPGIKDPVTLAVHGLDGSIWDQRARQIRYPTGFDMLIVVDTQLVAVPRSTQVEIL